MAAINTKFNLGQQVYFIKNNKVCTDKVWYASIILLKSRLASREPDTEVSLTIHYSLLVENQSKGVDESTLINENRLFASVDELLESLKQQTPQPA